MKIRAKLITSALAVGLCASTVKADFTISNTTTSTQVLTGQSGTVTTTGYVNVGGSANAVTVGAGTASLVNSGTINQNGTGRTIRNNSGSANLTITNDLGGLIQSIGSDVIQVSVANSRVTLFNSGSIISLNSGSGGAQALEWDGITTGSNSLTNYATGVIRANYADAIRMGVNGIVNNQGLIEARPFLELDANTGLLDASSSDGIDTQNSSGVQITNTGTIRGRHGITGGENQSTFTVGVTNNAGGLITAVNGAGINIDGNPASPGSATVVNNGTIIGQYDFATYQQGDGDGVDVDGVLTLTNSGTIRGMNAGGDGNNAEGVAAGGGSITNNVGGVISGENNAPGDALGNGILIDDSNGGNAFAATTVTNSGEISGAGGYGIRVIGTFSDTITNNASGTIRGGATMGAIQMGGGNDVLTNRGTIIHDTNGMAIALEDGNDTLNVEGGSASIIGDISGGTGTNAAYLNPGTGNTFSYAGSLINFDLIEVQSGTVILTGESTAEGTVSINGGTLILEDGGKLSSNNTLSLSEGTLRLLNGEEQAFASFSLLGDATIDLANTASLRFDTFGTYEEGASLTINYHNYLPGTFYFAGDLTGNEEFNLFLSNLTINGEAVTAAFDGENTRVIPEPSTYALLILAGMVLFLRRRRKSTSS